MVVLRAGSWGVRTATVAQQDHHCGVFNHWCVVHVRRSKGKWWQLFAMPLITLSCRSCAAIQYEQVTAPCTGNLIYYLDKM